MKNNKLWETEIIQVMNAKHYTVTGNVTFNMGVIYKALLLYLIKKF